MIDMIITIMTVPKMAGNTPPSVLGSRGSSETKPPQPALDLRPRGRVARDDGAALLEGGDAADEESPLAALDHRDVGRALAPHDGGLVHPDEVGAVEIAIGDLELDPPRLAPAGDPLAIGEGTGQHLAVRERDAHHLGGPEEAGGVADDDRDEADDHDEGGGERAAGQPDEGLAAAPEASHQRYRYFRRSRRRTTSAVVLSTKVRQKRRNAARKRTRKSVPPSGASGSSTAMLAERARKPLNMFQSITGVLPVAISTIIVSPTARPRPIMIAEKMLGLAVGSTMRTGVCQRLAPSASDPARRCWGTLASASSAIVKMSGTTAKPMATPTTSELR